MGLFSNLNLSVDANLITPGGTISADAVAGLLAPRINASGIPATAPVPNPAQLAAYSPGGGAMGWIKRNPLLAGIGAVVGVVLAVLILRR